MAISKKRRDAINKENAQKSTGPKSEEGKSRSALNSFRHGLSAQHLVLHDKDLAAYGALGGRMVSTLAPVGNQEDNLVQLLIDSYWLMSHAHALEINSRALEALAIHLGDGRDCQELGAAALDISDHHLHMRAPIGKDGKEIRPSPIRNIEALSRHRARISRFHYQTRNELRLVQKERREAHAEGTPLDLDFDLKRSHAMQIYNAIQQTHPEDYNERIPQPLEVGFAIEAFESLDDASSTRVVTQKKREVIIRWIDHLGIDKRYGPEFTDPKDPNYKGPENDPNMTKGKGGPLNPPHPPWTPAKKPPFDGGNTGGGTGGNTGQAGGGAAPPSGNGSGPSASLKRKVILIEHPLNWNRCETKKTKRTHPIVTGDESTTSSQITIPTPTPNRRVGSLRCLPPKSRRAQQSPQITKRTHPHLTNPQSITSSQNPAPIPPHLTAPRKRFSGTSARPKAYGV